MFHCFFLWKHPDLKSSFCSGVFFSGSHFTTCVSYSPYIIKVHFSKQSILNRHSACHVLRSFKNHENNTTTFIFPKLQRSVTIMPFTSCSHFPCTYGRTGEPGSSDMDNKSLAVKLLAATYSMSCRHKEHLVGTWRILNVKRYTKFRR